MPDPTPPDCTTQLRALLAEIAELRNLQNALPIRIHILESRAKALRAYARTLPETTQELP